MISNVWLIYARIYQFLENLGDWKARIDEEVERELSDEREESDEEQEKRHIPEGNQLS